MVIALRPFREASLESELAERLRGFCGMPAGLISRGILLVRLGKLRFFGLKDANALLGVFLLRRKGAITETCATCSAWRACGNFNLSLFPAHFGRGPRPNFCFFFPVFGTGSTYRCTRELVRLKHALLLYSDTARIACQNSNFCFLPRFGATCLVLLLCPVAELGGRAVLNHFQLSSTKKET